MMIKFSEDDMPAIISCLSKRMGDGIMGKASMPPEGIMDRLLQGSSTREDLFLLRELLQEEKTERATIFSDDPSLTQGITALNMMADSILERIEEALAGES